METLYQRTRFGPFRALLAALVWGAQGIVSALAATPVTELPTSEIFVHDIKPMPGTAIRNVSTLDWSARTNLLLYGKRGLNQYCNVFSATPEGFNQTSLSRDRGRTTTRLHNSCPTWHPDGKIFVFSGQSKGSTDYRRSGPDGGWHCNLWAGTQDGDQHWQLTTLPTRYNTPSGATMPALSPDGKKIVWTGFPGKRATSTAYEQRALYLADFEIVDDVPVIKNEQTLRTGNRRSYYESYAFSPDGGTILFASNHDGAQPWYCMDICVLARGQAEAVVLSPNETGWDRYASYSPDGRKIVWASSRTFNIPFLGQGGVGWERYLRTELWIMDADGDDPKQLTFFNTKDAEESNGRRAFVGDTVWSPDGDRIAVVLHREGRSFDVVSQIVFLTLGKGEPGASPQPEPSRQRPVRPSQGREAIPVVPSLTW